MRRALKWTAVLSAVAGLLGVVAFVHVWYFKPLSIDWFYGRLFAQYALDSPETLSSLRVLPPWLDFYGADFDDVSPAAERRRAALARDALDTLRRYDRSAQDAEGRLSYDTLEYFLRVQVDGESFRDHDFPLNQVFGLQSALPDFMVQIHQVNSLRDAQNYIARLAKFPRKFDQLLESLALREGKGVIPPRFTVDKVLAQMRGFVAPPPAANVLYTSFAEKLARVPDETIARPERERLLARAEAAVRDSVYPAYAKLIAHMDALRPRATANHGAWSLPDGDAYYAWCVRMHTTTSMTPQELHALGLREVERVAGEMDAILRSLGQVDGGVGERMRRLSRDPAQHYANTPEGKREMLARFQALLDGANVKANEAFDVRPKQGVEVKPVPAFSEATAPLAYYGGGSVDGSRPGVFFVNTRDTAAMPKFQMATLAYHEGIPGHHFQDSIALELTGVPFFRRIIPFTAYAEGWALYAERLAWELGLETDPLDNLGRLRDEMFRAVRLVVDTGIHAQRWTPEQAIDYMQANTGLADADVTAEIERYFVQPGQALAYKVGMIEILSLREKARQALGEKFDLKKFHDEVLTHGALPLSVLERVIDDWIAKTRRA